MRSHNDLFGAFDSVDTDSVDPDEMLARVHTGSAALQTARRRRVAVLSVAAAAILLAVGAILVPTLGGDRPDGGNVANTPSGEPVPGVAGTPPGLSFTLGERPAGYSNEYVSVGSELELVSLTAGDPASSPDASSRIEILIFDPLLARMPAPDLVGETVTVESVSAGQLSVEVIAAGTNENEEPQFGVGWRISDGRWLTITGDAPGDLARQEVLAVAAEVDISVARKLIFPFHLGYVPDGFAIAGADQAADGNRGLQAGLSFQSPTQDPRQPDWLTVAATHLRGVPEDRTVNTTVGTYYAELTPMEGSGPQLAIFDVQGFMIYISAAASDVDRVDEADLRRIAESIVVIPGAATDTTVWTDQPIG